MRKKKLRKENIYTNLKGRDKKCANRNKLNQRSQFGNKVRLEEECKDI
jgi:hypothetical protein